MGSYLYRELGREQTRADDFLAASQLQYKVEIPLFPLCFISIAGFFKSQSK